MRRFLHETAQLRHEPAGGKRDVARADVHALRRGNKAQEAHHVFVIVKRLPASHEDDVRHGAFAPFFAGYVPFRTGDKTQDLAGFQIPHAAIERGSAERAAHPAADLRGNAERVAVFIAHQHAFHKVAVLKREQVFDRPVLCRNALIVDACTAIWEGGKLFAQRLAKVRHLLRPCAA